ncbi:MAG: hypothetical protein CMN30_02105 [Sandaracinus sp.]|nr:hypothetical protein [Sandaracinus sp.]|tara:strand:+ start:1476 stop:2111 length:636 start_codon:yes stop_codon:yes gene_type:complete
MTPVLRRSLLLVGLALPALLAGASAAQDDPQPREPSPRVIARALARYRHEPTVEVLLRAIADDEAFDPERARALARRARRGGWLPTLQVGARRGQQRDLSQAGADDPRLSTDDDLTLDATLTFRLDRAAYGPDEVALAREERTRELERQERYRVVIAAYYERRRLQLERDLMGRHDVLTAVRIRELAALLDAFTGGAFTRGTRRRAEGLRP